MYKKLIFIYMVLFMAGVTIMGIDVDYYIKEKKYPKLTTLKIKQNIFIKKYIPNMKGYNRLAQLWANNEFLITTGDVNGDDGFLEILTYPDFELKHRETTNDERGGLRPLGYSFFYDNKFFTSGSLNHFEWITYYDLKTFSEHKAMERYDRLGLYNILSDGRLITRIQRKGINIYNKDYKLEKSFSVDELAKANNVTNYFKDIYIKYTDENEIFYTISISHGSDPSSSILGRIDLNNYEIKPLVKFPKIIYTPSMFKINNSLYISTVNHEGPLPANIYKYNNQDGSVTKLSNEVDFLFFPYILEAQINDLTFLKYYGAVNQIIIIKGEFEKAIRIRVKKFENIGPNIEHIGKIIKIIPYKDKYLLAGQFGGIFEFDINDIYDLLDEYGETFPTKLLVMP